MDETKIFKFADFKKRTDFGTFLNEKGLINSAVEIGVHRGWFSRQFLDRWVGKKFYAIDPWDDYLESYADQNRLLPNYETNEEGTGSRIFDMIRAMDVTHIHRHRVVYLRTTSAKALDLVENGLDYAYVDGDHREEAVDWDTNNWWKKLRSGGIMAGHDLCFPGEPNFPWSSNVQSVLTKFAERNNVIIYMVPDLLEPWSWYIEKP